MHTYKVTLVHAPVDHGCTTADTATNADDCPLTNGCLSFDGLLAIDELRSLLKERERLAPSTVVPTLFKGKQVLAFTQPIMELIRAFGDDKKEHTESMVYLRQLSANVANCDPGEELASTYKGDSLATTNIVDIPFPPNWLSNLGVIGNTHGTTPPNLLVTLGMHQSRPHIEEHASAQYAQLLTGQKVWKFWRPGAPIKMMQKKKLEFSRNNEPCNPDVTLYQESGDTILIPGGWYHGVYTLTHGAILCGQLWPGALVNVQQSTA